MSENKMMKRINQEGQKLKQAKIVYDSKKYATTNTFFNTADIVLISVIDNELGVLLIKRKEMPFQGSWAIPGGYVDANKDLDAEAAARRELAEETGISDVYLEQLYTFSTQSRDPREMIANHPVRIWSVAHFALIDYTKVHAVAGSDAGEVRWFKISELPELAFDHEKIISMSIDRVRGKLSYSNLGFELVPEEFTIPELQEIFEKVMGEPLDRNNFRTKLLKMEILIATKKVKKGVGKPAPYYRLDRNKLKTLKGRSLF